MLSLELNPEEYQPQPPEKRDYGIGLIGRGGIARGAHLPACRQFGYRVVASRCRNSALYPRRRSRA